MTRYERRLYQNNAMYEIRKFSDRSEWLHGRSTGLGGSDAAAAIGRNPWKDNHRLWEEKTGRVDPEDISGKDVVIYGNDVEEPLRQIYKAKHWQDMDVHYMKNVTLQSRSDPVLRYSPDGLLVERSTGRKGILEIKTSRINRAMDREKWNERIPENYLIQVLHGMLVTGFEFADLFAELTYSADYAALREYRIERADYEDFLADLKSELLDFWKHVEEDTEPALLLPMF